MRSTPQSAPRSGRPHRLFALVMCWSALLSLTGCAAPRPTTKPIDPPPAALAAPCQAGPAYPAGSLPLGELVDIVAAREAAAADCRARHGALVSSWPK